MTGEQQRVALVDFLATVAKPGRRIDGVDDDTNLIQAEIIDSFALIQIIFHLEEVYGVNLQAMGVDPADLSSIGGMMGVIGRAGQ